MPDFVNSLAAFDDNSSQRRKITSYAKERNTGRCGLHDVCYYCMEWTLFRAVSKETNSSKAGTLFYIIKRTVVNRSYMFIE